MHEFQNSGVNETTNASILDPLFPSDLFTQNERGNGAIILHIFGVTYMFVALTIVCFEFIVPTIEAVIKRFQIGDDIAAAIFMAIGLNTIQFLISLFGLSISYDDIGVGTIIGAGAFKMLFVIGVCAICSKTVLSLKWFPLLRDCGFYGISLFALFCFLQYRNMIFWWEAIVLSLIYFCYMGCMMISPYLVKKINVPCLTTSTVTQSETATSRSSNDVHYNVQEMIITEDISSNSLWDALDNANKLIATILRIIIYPIFIPLWATLPDMQKPRSNIFTWRLVALWSFFGSILWLAVFSYLLMWWTNTISETIEISPGVLSFTIFAAGFSIPNLIWAVIMARKGFGDLAISCTIGSNIFGLTFCLPIPRLYILWFQEPIAVYATGVDCLISILLMSLKIVTTLLACFKWRLTKEFGIIMILLYFVFIAFVLLFEYTNFSCPFS